jgi:DNA (cytosine-5)-methyltransferase 1
MRYLSLFSGIEAASVAWHGLGWQPVAFAEIEPFPSAVLKERFPSVPNWGDVSKFKEWPDVCLCPSGSGKDVSELTGFGMESTTDVHVEYRGCSWSSYCGNCNRIYKPNLIVGGSPCQSFSVAGLRKGMDDPRGNLALTYLAIVEKYQPEWIVWENVPGVLSSSGGRDFGSFLGALDEIGYGYAWRVLDAQYTRTPFYPRAVPQRRKRVFVVGCLGDWRSAAAVLFDGESLCGNPPPSREAGKGFTAIAPSGVGGEGARGVNYQEVIGALCADDAKQIGNQYVSQDKVILEEPYTFKVRGGSETETGEQGGTPGKKAGKGFLASDGIAFTVASTQDPWLAESSTIAALPINSMAVQGRPSDNGKMTFGIGEDGDPCPTLQKAHSHAVAFYHTNRQPEYGNYEEVSPTIKVGASGSGGNPPAVQQSMQVRRLTPLECERLQGFPDGWTQIAWRKKAAEECPDGPRYKAIGNSMAVNVMQWIGLRIAMMNEILEEGLGDADNN